MKINIDMSWLLIGAIILTALGVFLFTQADPQEELISIVHGMTPYEPKPMPTATPLNFPEKVRDPQEITIIIKENSLHPTNINGYKGDTLTWKNEDETIHNITVKGLGINQDIEPGETFTHNTESAGIYNYSSSTTRGLNGQVSLENNLITTLEASVKAAHSARRFN